MKTIACSLAALALISCGKAGEKEKPAGKDEAPTGVAVEPSGKAIVPTTAIRQETPVADDPVRPEETATVTGSGRLLGTPPPARKALITKDTEVCGKGEREIVEVDVNDKGLLQNAVVFVAGDLEGVKAPSHAPSEFTVRQQGCRFIPYIIPIPKGASLKVENADKVAHNIHAYEPIGRARRDLFNLSQPQQGDVRSERIAPRKGQVVELTCDVHDFMSGWIFVTENPFATVTEAGTFTLEGVPAGRRTIKTFHPILGTREKQVHFPAGGEVTVEFEFAAP